MAFGVRLSSGTAGEHYRQRAHAAPMAARAALNDAAHALAEDIRRDTPIKTGKARASIRVYTSSGYSREIRSSVPYLPYLEFGTGIYGPRGVPIVPVRAKFLSWVDNGVRRFARSVQGIRPRFMFRDNMKNAHRYLTEAWSRQMWRA